MMRLLILTPFLMLAACSEGEQPVKGEAEAPAKQLTAGQWEMTTEITKVTPRDKGKPALSATEGSNTTTSTCVAEADVKKPQPALFTSEELECTNRDVYMMRGRVNSTLACKKAGAPGDIAVIVNGTFKADSFEGTSTTETALHGEGDMKVDAKLTGRRTGECSAPEGDAKTGAKAGG